MSRGDRDTLLAGLRDASFDVTGSAEPPEGFLEGVLARTSLAPASRRFADAWQRLMLRPRFAYEAAYVGVVTICLACASLGGASAPARTMRAGVAIQEICSEAGVLVSRATSYLQPKETR